jgi:antirestriction protein
MNEQQPKRPEGLPEQEPNAIRLPEENKQSADSSPIENEQVGASAEDGSRPEAGELNGDQPEKQEPTEPPQIWVGSWLDYNNGRLHGEWIDAARETDEVWADIQAMLAASPTAKQSGEAAEEWGIFDYENFGALKVGEQETISFVAAVARGIAEHGLAFSAWADVMEEEEALGGFADSYLGEYDSMEAYAEQLIDDLDYNQLLDEALPEHVRRYVEINVAGLAQDMWLGGDVNVYQKEGGGVWLFDGR